MRFYAADYKDYETSTEKEWLLTNGLGGYASSTVTGANTRRYHSLLAISKKPPSEKVLLVSKLDETVVFSDTEMSLSSQRVDGHVVCGFRHLQSVDIGDSISYVYLAGTAFIKKTVSLVKFQNRVKIGYDIINRGEPFKLRITPLMNARNIHSVSRKETLIADKPVLKDDRFVFSLNDLDGITLEFGGCVFRQLEETYYLSMEYDRDMQQGSEYIEDHYIPGQIEKDIGEGTDASIVIEIYIGEKKESLPVNGVSSYTSPGERLERACDDFVVKRGDGGLSSIVAGYPWFDDWGRDAMISLPGVLLETGRLEEAKSVLRTFASHEKSGLIPNRLPSGTGDALYNTADTSLWFINAIDATNRKAKDDFAGKEMAGTVKRIIGNYRAGTLFGICMDTDGLITAGDEYLQLTWMDAKVGDFVITPRHGKAVEVNALWYNALCVLYELSGETVYRNLADKVFHSFNEKFVDEENRLLYDYIDSGFEKKRSSDIRPNALFAISLAYPVLDRGYWKGVFERIFKELYTPYGIRSLSFLSGDYRGYYGGDRFERDTAYHQGTAWAWLIGAFIEAYLKIYDDRESAYDLICPLLGHLDEAGINSVSEIFEGSFPHRARGAYAHACSAGELLRAYNMIKGNGK